MEKSTLKAVICSLMVCLTFSLYILHVNSKSYEKQLMRNYNNGYLEGSKNQYKFDMDNHIKIYGDSASYHYIKDYLIFYDLKETKDHLLYNLSKKLLN